MSGRGKIGVLISGRGSNMEALAIACKENQIPARIAVVVSNEPAAAGIARAHRHGIETAVIDHRECKGRGGREAHDRRVAEVLDAAGCDLVCLAGYMRLLSPWFVGHYKDRILNVHPALLPAFPGLDAQKAAWEHGVKVSGATVHFVDEDCDHGPIILQATLPVLEDDTADTLAARILVEEHLIYPKAVRLFFEGKLKVKGRRVMVAE